MTKPIEWTTEPRTVPGDTLQLQVRYPVHDESESPSGWRWRPATPSDLVAALAAMPLGDRETVLSASWNGIVMRGDYEHMVAERKEATARAEKAEAEITEVRRVLGVRDNAVTASTAAWRMGEITAATKRAEKAERERDEARKELGTLHVERQAIAAALGLLPGERIGEGRLSVAARLACEERDSLRARLIAAESAAAAREPREYPLAEGSVWRDGRTVRDDDGVDLSIDQGVLVVRQEGDAATVKIMCYLADVLALAHRRGLL